MKLAISAKAGLSSGSTCRQIVTRNSMFLRSSGFGYASRSSGEGGVIELKKRKERTLPKL
jgi:hypothetical protein